LLSTKVQANQHHCLSNQRLRSSLMSLLLLLIMVLRAAIFEARG
jgi:hypothetical protein